MDMGGYLFVFCIGKLGGPGLKNVKSDRERFLLQNGDKIKYNIPITILYQNSFVFGERRVPVC